MFELLKRTPYRQAAGTAALALALALAGCSAGAVSTQVSNVAGTGVAVATQAGPTAAALATSAANASGTALPGAQQTAAAIATQAPGQVGSAVSGVRPTVAAIATSIATAGGGGGPNIPGVGVMRTGTFVKKTQEGAGGVEVVSGLGGAGVVRLGQDFKVTGSGKLAVYLTKEASPGTRAEVEVGFLDLGELRSASGPSVYQVPRGSDLNAYTGVVIYSVDQQVPLIAAPLSQPQGR
ncbi:MAG TPA: DM13 domain-containing protein [Thermomicrobiales bacterium]|jgi:hypothetical protein